MNDRATTLGRIRAALGSRAHDASRQGVVDQRLRGRPRGVLPARARIGGAERLVLLEEKLRASGATLARAATPEAVVAEVVATLKAHGLPLRLRLGFDQLLAALPWTCAPELDRHGGAAHRDDAASLVRAVAAAAETGTLFVSSGADNPTTLNFLPDFAIVLVRSADVMGGYEDCFDRVRSEYAASWPPRAINLIGGPSRTADIEQTIVLGAHGPRALHVVLWL